MTKYIIRFDDFYTGMDNIKYEQISEWLLKEKIPAIVGVTPAWEYGSFDPFDDKFIENDIKKDIRGKNTKTINPTFFFERIRQLSNSGCDIALHGYTHKLFRCKNILNVYPYGEFSGLPYGEQKKRIIKGKKYFKAHGLCCRMFMAPAHSFDENTLKVLRECDIRIITDGKAFYPYEMKGITFIPQISSSPKSIPFGIITICLHHQHMHAASFKNLKSFVLKFRDSIVSVDFALQYFNSISFSVKILNALSRIAFKQYGNIRRAKSIFSK